MASVASGSRTALEAASARNVRLPDVPVPRRRGMALRVTTLVALLLMLATLAGGGLGYLYAVQSDEQLEAERRAALLASVDEYHVAFGGARSVDPRLVRMLERASGLKRLRFDQEPGNGERAVQAVTDANGRIVGWFSWDRERPMSAALERLWPALVGFGLCVVGFAAMALRQMRRSARELAASEAQIYRSAREDMLTGLPNDRRMLELLDEALAQRKSTKVVTFAFLDLDDFDDIANALGRAGADGVLAEIADRLQVALPEDAVIGRFGGEEFAVILVSDDAEAAVRTMRAAVGAVSRPVWMEQMILIGLSAGLAQAPRDAATRDDLVRRADLALLSSRRKGRGLVMRFEPELESAMEDRHFLRRELKRAIDEQTLQVHYQPIVAAEGSRVVGVEALLRWTHPTRGAIPPTVFIEVAEKCGLMDQLGALVLRQAMTDARRWPELFVCINLSPIQVRDRALVHIVQTLLAETGLEANRVVLEITEGVLIESPEDARGRLQKLRALGIRIALDDFGSGYSSLAYLQQFPIDKLKIDKSFVDPLGRSSNGGVIIHAIVALGRALGLSVLVEGVETEEQRVLLRLAGCDEMQGYLFAKPAPRAAIDKLIEARGGNLAALRPAATPVVA